MFWFFHFYFFPLSPCFVLFYFELGVGWEIWVFMSSTHLGTEMQYCKEEGPPAHTNITISCVEGTIVLTFVRHIKHAKWRDQDSPIWTCWGAQRPLHGILWVSCWRGHRKIGWNVTGLLTKAHWEAISGSVVASPGEVWVVVLGITFGLMDLDSELEEPAVSDAIARGHAFADSP